MSINDKFDQTTKTRYLKSANKYTIWKVIGLFIVGLLFAGVMLVFYFIYQYTYLTLTNANAILSLSSSLGVDIIDNKNFSLSQDIISSQKALPELTEKVRNIFYYVQTPSSTVTSSSKTQR